MKYICSNCLEIHDTKDYVHFKPKVKPMSTEAEVIVIGPFKDLQDADALDYPLRYYDTQDTDSIVMGSAAYAATRTESELLAEICGVEFWNLEKYEITNPVKPESIHFGLSYTIGGENAELIYRRIKQLVLNPKVQVWFRPNF
jgi:hypothetical protein